MQSTDEKNQNIYLTQTVQKGGCAAKVAAVELRQILEKIKFPPKPAELIVGAQTFDDAALYKINDTLALVQTLDFFTPIVDTPKIFGKIAAANALSDVYAMGGVPKTAMAIFAFPLATMENQVAIDVLQGASDVIEKSKAAFIGGHTIDDDTMKFGLSVTGYVNPSLAWANTSVKIDDCLILTKPIGTGTLTAALKRQEVNESQINFAIQSMSQLNNVVDYLDEELKLAIHSATDITGFGLAGHALNMAKASQVSLSIELENIPIFPNVFEFLEKGFLTKAHRTNFEYIQSQTTFLKTEKHWQQLVCDPQTSGGLLLSVAKDKVDLILKSLNKEFISAKVIGYADACKDKYLKFI